MLSRTGEGPKDVGYVELEEGGAFPSTFFAGGFPKALGSIDVVACDCLIVG